MYRFCLFFILLTCSLISCKKREKVTAIEIPRPVRVVKVEALGTITRQFTGVVEAKEHSILAFKINGTLTELNVVAGQKVKKGDIIAKIKPYDYRLLYQTAKTNYETAKSIYERNRRLSASDAVARQNLEIAEADYIQATSALNLAQRTLNNTVLKAPFDGFIEKRFADNYEEILAGQAIVQLVNPEDIEIHFNLPEANIQLLQLPKKIYVEFDSQKGKLFTSDIKEYVYASTGTGIPVTLIVTDQQFKPYREDVYPGFSCKVIWEIDNMISDKFIIPASALQQEDGKEYVWLVDPSTHTAERQEIITRRLDGHILVESGLNSDDLLIIAGVSSIKEGQKVSIQNQNL